MPLHRKLVLAEASLCALGAWVLVRCIPYGVWRSKWGASVPLATIQTDGSLVSSSSDSDFAEIAWALQKIERFAGAHVTCLMLAKSAQMMLGRRGFSSVLILGVNRGMETGMLGAHAWVVCNGVSIVGGEQQSGNVPVAAFENAPITQAGDRARGAS
jgi:hypothetical protein